MSTLLLAMLAQLGTASGDSLSRTAPLQVLDEGVRQGAASEVNCSGAGVTCTRSGNRWTLSVAGGGGGGPTLTLADYLELTNSSTPTTPTGAIRLYGVDESGWSRLESVGPNGFVIRYGRDAITVVRNNTGSTINKGEVVALATTSTTNQVRVVKADATGTVNLPTVGFMGANCTNGSDCPMVSAGILDGLNTSGFTDGDRIFTGTTPGTFTATQPTHPNLRQRVGVVINAHPSQGAVFVDPTGVRGDHEGTMLSEWIVGPATGAGAVSVSFRNANTGTLSWAPTGTRTLTLPDTTDTLVGLNTSDTLANKTLTTPTIVSFANAQHAHTSAAGGGSLGASAIASGTLTQAVGGTGAGALTCTNQFVTSNGTAQACTTATLASAQFANQGTTTTVLHGNAAGNPSFSAVSLTADVSGILPTANGGTGTAFFTVAGPATSAKTFTFPNASASVFTDQGTHGHTSASTGGQLNAGSVFSTGLVPIANGGTNSSATATNGGAAYGTGTAYAFTAAGSAGECLKSNGVAAPTWGSCAAGGGYATIQDEGSGLTARTTLNFAGAGVSCADDTTRTTCTIAGGGGTPGGATTEIQYNNAGAFAGAPNVTVGPSGNLRLAAVGATPAPPAAGYMQLYPVNKAGRTLLNFQGPSGLDSPVQPALFANAVAFWLPNTTTTLHAVGMLATVTATMSHPTLATTNLWSSIKRWRLATSTTAGNVSSVRSNADVVWRGNAAGRGGFFLAARCTAFTTSANGRGYVGLRDATAVHGNVNSSTLLDAAYFGFDSGQTTWRFCTNDNTGSATCTDLGANFPVNLPSDGFEFRMFAQPNNTEIGWYAQRLGTGDEASGTATTDLPRNTVLYAAEIAVGNGADASANIMECTRLYLESDL